MCKYCYAATNWPFYRNKTLSNMHSLHINGFEERYRDIVCKCLVNIPFFLVHCNSRTLPPTITAISTYFHEFWSVYHLPHNMEVSKSLSVLIECILFSITQVQKLAFCLLLYSVSIIIFIFPSPTFFHIFCSTYSLWNRKKKLHYDRLPLFCCRAGFLINCAIYISPFTCFYYTWSETFSGLVFKIIAHHKVNLYCPYSILREWAWFEKNNEVVLQHLSLSSSSLLFWSWIEKKKKLLGI